jgi:hypothetical protein
MVFFFVMPTNWGQGNGPIAHREFNALFPLIFMLGYSNLPELAFPLVLYMLFAQGAPHTNDALRPRWYHFVALMAFIMYFFPRDPEAPTRYEYEDEYGGSEEALDMRDLTLVHTVFLLLGLLALVVTKWDEVYRFLLTRLPTALAVRFRAAVRRLGLTPARNGLAPTSPEVLAGLDRFQAAGNEGECSVCLDRLDAGQRTLRLGCKHCFHEQCLTPWLEQRSSCPVCRQGVEEPGLGPGASQSDHPQQPDPQQEEPHAARPRRNSFGAMARSVFSLAGVLIRPAPTLDQAVATEERQRLLRLPVHELKTMARLRGVDLRGVADKEDIVRCLLATRRHGGSDDGH